MSRVRYREKALMKQRKGLRSEAVLWELCGDGWELRAESCTAPAPSGAGGAQAAVGGGQNSSTSTPLAPAVCSGRGGALLAWALGSG